MAQGSPLTRNANIPHGSKNLLQRVILYRHKKIYVGKGRLQANTGETICSFGWLFDDISGLTNSFGLSSFVNLDMVSLLPWIAAGSSRKSI